MLTNGQLLKFTGSHLSLLHLLLLDQLLCGLEVFQGDTLSGTAGLTDPLGVGLALGLALLVTDRGHEGSKQRETAYPFILTAVIGRGRI